MKTTRRDKELFESQHYTGGITRPLTFPFSRSFSAQLNGGSIRYGMWWDENSPGNYISLPIDGESGMIFETTMQNTASKVIGALSDVAGGTYFGYFLDGGTGNTQATAGTPAYYVDGVLVANDQDDLHDALSDGLPHAFRVTGLDLSDEDWTQMIIGGYNANFIPEGTYRDVVLRQSDETIVGRWNGYGNTNADWLDQGTGNYGMWFDNVDDRVTIPTPAVTVDIKMKVTQAGSGTAGMALASSNSGSTFLLSSQSGSSSSISSGSGTPTITVDGVAVTTRDALFNALADGLEHEVIATDADLSSWTSLYLGTYSAAGVWAWEGSIWDVRFYNSSTDALIHQYDGHGNTDADWEDQVGSNDGTVYGSPSQAVSTSTGWRKRNNGTVSGSPSRAISTDGGATWAMETASDADAAAYVTRLLNTGTSITPAQISALDTFFLTGKSEGWYSALKRMYLPIWAAAGPNAIDMIGGTSGTFVGGVTHSAGYVTGNGTTGYFRTDAKIPAVASIEDVLVGTLNNTGHHAANKVGIGSGATGGTSIRHASENSATKPRALVLGVNVTGSVTGTAGINLAAREGGTTYLGQKLGASSYGELSSTASLTSALDDHFVTVMGTAESDTGAGALSTSQTGGAVIATGMDATKRGKFVTAWEALWETTTGLTLP